MPGDDLYLCLLCDLQNKACNLEGTTGSDLSVCLGDALFSMNLTLEGLPGIEIAVGSILTTGEDTFQGKGYKDHNNS